MPPPGDSSLHTIGDYELLAVVGTGGCGTVYKGRHRQTGAVVAVKVMDPELAENPVLLKRFEQEFHTARTLNHPHLVRALAYGTNAAMPYLVMEFVDGESLGECLKRVGRQPEAEAVRLIVQVAQGLATAHKRGLIHRDIKPDNILVTPDGQAKLTDLGLAKDLTGDLHLTRTGRGLGTSYFTAPEQIREAKHADVPSDIYSLGATLYHMVTGQVPFKGCSMVEAVHRKNRNDLPPARAVVPELSSRVESAIRRAMAAVPDKRHRSCQEFVEDVLGRKVVELEEPAPPAATALPDASTVVTRAAALEQRPATRAESAADAALESWPRRTPGGSAPPLKWIAAGLAVAVLALLAWWLMV